MLSTLIWTGAHSADWSDPLNWQGSVAPQSNDSLVFPADASNLLPVNDEPPGMQFGSIDIQSSGYDISGASVELTGDLTASLTSGTSFYQLATTLDDGTVDVAPGGQLLDFSTIAGTSGLELTGGGGLTLLGLTGNTFTGDTTVSSGTLTLEGAPGRYAVPGNLVIDGSGTVHYGDSFQVNPAATVTMDGGLLNLEGNDEDVGALVLNDGAQIYTGRADSINTGLMTLEGDVTVDASSPTFYGVMDLGPADRTFDVSGGTMTINGILQGSNALIKAGSGTLDLIVNNQDPAAVDIDAGVLDFEGGGSIDESSTDGITVASGATALLDNDGNVTVPVSIVGAGAGGVGALESSGNNTLSDLVLAGSATISSDYPWPGLTITDALTDGTGSGYSLTKIGGGEAVLAGANTYTGGTFADGGELYVSGSIIGTAQTADGGELGGSGTIGDASTDGGTIGAGRTATWDMEIEHYSSLTLDPTATFYAQVNGSTPGSGGYDQVVVSGAVALNNATLNLASYGLSNVVTMDLITGATSLTGTFNNLPEGGVVSAGGYDFQITYAGGAGGHDVVLNRVVPTTTSVPIPTDSSVYSQPVTFTATVDSIQGGTPTGTVTFYDGATDLGDAPLVGNTATLTTSVLPVGSDAITASYDGDANDETSTSSAVTQVVIKDGSSTGVTTSSASTVYGQSVTFTATVSAAAPGAGTPTGTVDFYDGTTLLASPTLVSGQATYTTGLLAPGTHDISVRYEGDSGYFLSDSDSITQTVGQATTTVPAPTSSGPSTFEDPVTFSVTVAPVAPGAGTPTGTVTFYDGTTELGTGTLDDTGTATFTTSDLDAGTHSITASYGGDDNFTGSTSAAATSQVVSAMDTTTVLTTTPASPADVAFGQSVTLTATVAPDAGATIPGGTVTFYDGDLAHAIGTGTLDGTGVATMTTGSLAYGAHSLFAVYGGQTDFSTSTSTDASVTVSLASPTVVVTSTTNPAASNQSVVFEVTVSPAYDGAATPTGTITLYNGATEITSGTLDVAGTYTVTAPPMPLGSYSITASYGGDSNYQSGTSTAMTLVIEKPTDLSVTTTSGTSRFGQSVTFTATVTPAGPDPTTPTGTVTFLDGSTAIGTGTLNTSGQATFTTASLSPGSHSITVVYFGDANYAPNTSTPTTQVVQQASTTATLTTSAAAPAFGQSVTLTATVAPVAPGAGVPTGTVSFYDGSSLLGTSTLDGSGRATRVVDGLSIGSHPIKVVYAGDDDFTTSTSTTTTEGVVQASTSLALVSSGATRTYGEPVTFTATVAPVAPGAGVPSGTVTFYSGTTPIGSAALAGSPASASITLSSLDAGSYSITAGFAGDADFAGSTSAAIGETISPAATATVLQGPGLPAGFGQAETLVATVSTVAPGSGTPTGTVQFFAGTTPIGSATLDGGVATLQTTSIPKGSQTLTATFSGSADFLASYSPPVSQEVTASSTRAVLSGGGSAVLGQSLTFTATISPVAPATVIPTGYVLFEDGMVPIATAPLDANGVATFTTAGLGLGSHTITAVYGGDAGYTLSTTPSVTVTVAPCLTGTVYLDLGAGRSLAEGGLGLGGQVVFLDLNHDGSPDAGDPTATTDAGGQFAFPGYAPGVAAVGIVSGQGPAGRYVVDRQGLDPGGDVVIGVMPTSAVTPVQILVAPSTTGLPPASSPNEGYVQSLYVDLLGRAGSAAEVAHWVGRLDRGMSRRRVAESFVNSLAHRRAEVAVYSQEFLGQPSAPGSNRLVRALRSGVSEEKVVTRILDSPQYQATHTDPALFVHDLYIEVLGQVPTQAEVASAEGQVSSARGRRRLVARLVESSTVDAQVVDSLFAAYLHRQPDAAELQRWTSALQKPGGSAGGVAAGILASREFYRQSQGGNP